MNETFLFTALAIAFVSTMTIVRHTRQNEEFGRSDLIESGIVSRHASLTAAMTVVVLVNVIFGLFVYQSLVAYGLPAAGSLGAGAAMAATGITFAAIAAVAAQLADSARGANSFSALAIGVAFMFRSVGDGIGTLAQNGLAVKSAFPSWLSPFGWGQQIHPMTEQNWWIFSLFVGLFAAALGTAVTFMARRDIGIGMIPTKPGSARAPKVLLSPLGLARRLQRGTLRGWAVAIIILGASYGLVINEFSDFIAENEQFQEAFAQFGGGVSPSDIFLSVLISMMAVLITGYAVQALLRLRSEEANGQLESILGTSVSRPRWQMSHIGFVALGVLLLTALSGLSMGATYIATTGNSWGELWPVLGASFANSTAIFALMGFVTAMIALFPHLATAIAWASFAGCLLIVQLGVLLKLPVWVLNLSPFGHLPAMPAEKFEIAPILWLSFTAFSFVAAALIYFNRRDIVTA
jgi:ABC-2 type transport system permease protein